MKLIAHHLRLRQRVWQRVRLRLCLRARRATRQRARPAGQAAIEYLIVVALLALALTIGPQSPLEQLFRAVADRYERFSYALSRP